MISKNARTSIAATALVAIASTVMLATPAQAGSTPEQPGTMTLSARSWR